MQAALPEVPTIAEAGVPGFRFVGNWDGWFAPAGTPPAIIDRIYRSIREVLQVPRIRDAIIAAGYDPRGATRLFETIRKARGGGESSYLSTHPGLDERISRTLALARDDSFILLRRVADEAEVLTLCTHPEARRRGRAGEGAGATAGRA